jgi:hypothetical protein
MSGPPATPSPAAPSVFLSYASQDREAVRRLRDALAAAGLDVWYDENELTGGDSWDRKIRRQIRDCTYVMPVISRQASARLEGYFRREWRLAIERTLDMADDVIFLLPVVIDDSRDDQARVPDEFFRVQWLHVPGGQPTAGLQELAERLLAGGHERLHRSDAPRRNRQVAAAPAKVKHPPPKWLQPVIEFWRWLPRWARVFGWIFIVLFMMKACNWVTSSPGKRAAQTALTKKYTQAGEGGTTADQFTRIAETVIGSLASGALSITAPDVLLLPFDTGEDDDDFCDAVFGHLLKQLFASDKIKAGLSPMPLTGKPGDATAIERGRSRQARFVLTGKTAVQEGTGTEVLSVRIEDVASGQTVYRGEFSVKMPPDEAAAAISTKVRELPPAAAPVAK